MRRGPKRWRSRHSTPSRGDTGAATRRLADGDPGLVGDVRSLRHLIIDEAQDLVGPRREFCEALIAALHPKCGVTAFGDPAQAIFAFQAPDADRRTLFSDLTDRAGFRRAALLHDHRSESPALARFVRDARPALLTPGVVPKQAYFDVRKLIEENAVESGLSGCASHPSTSRGLVLVRSHSSLLTLAEDFRWAGRRFRLRLPGRPLRVEPWIGAMLGGLPENTTLDRGMVEVLHADMHPRSALDPAGCWEVREARECDVRVDLDEAAEPGFDGIDLSGPGLAGHSLHVRISSWGDVRLVTLALSNDTDLGPKAERIEVEEAMLFQMALSVSCEEGARFVPKPERAHPGEGEDDASAAALLFRDAHQYAVGHTCSAMWDKDAGGSVFAIRSEWLPQSSVPGVSAAGDREFEPLIGRGADGVFGAGWLARQDQDEPRHQARRCRGSTLMRREEGRHFPVEKVPVDQPRKLHQFMARIDHVDQSWTEQVILPRGAGMWLHRRPGIAGFLHQRYKTLQFKANRTAASARNIIAVGVVQAGLKSPAPPRHLRR